MHQGGGGARVEVPNAPELNPVSEITIEAWVHPLVGADCHTIVAKESSGNGYWLGVCGGRLRFEVDGTETAVDGSLDIPVSDWTHVAVTFDGLVRRYYVNGVLDVDTTTPLALPITYAPILIGSNSTYGANFDGDIAEVRLWDMVRTQEEIRTELVSQIIDRRPGLVAVWGLEGNAEDALGAHPGIGVSVTFAGTAAPPAPGGPLHIPRLASSPTKDGLCTEGEYGSLRLPIWYEDGSMSWAYIGAGSTDLYVCMKRISLGSGANLPFAALYIDVDGGGGEFAGAAEYKLNVFSDNTISSEKGNGTGGFVPANLSSFQFSGAAPVGAEFYWNAEFRINRSLFPTSDQVFRLQVMNHWVTQVGDDHAWPVGFFWNRPSTWALVTIDDTVVPRADSAPPTVSFSGSPAGRRFEISDNIRFQVIATDDTDLAIARIVVDFETAGACEFLGTDDTGRMPCGYTGSFTPGLHRFWAEAVDHRGRVTRTPMQTFRVDVDGNVPNVRVTHTPRLPTSTQNVVLSAHARDPAGITEILFLLDIAPFTYSCRFDTPQGVATCELPLPPPNGRAGFTYRAKAFDGEGLTNVSLPRTVVFDSGGIDSDGDGLSDAVERGLCTSENSMDSDRDGLKDGWEVLGLTFDDGQIIDLPGMGANPCAKDIFLQYDWEMGARVEPPVINSVVNAFRDHDIALRVEEHPRPRPPTADVSPLGAVTAAFQKDSDGKYWFDPKKNWTHYYAYSRHKPGRSGSWGRYFSFDIAWDGNMRNPDGSYKLDTDGKKIRGSCVCPLDEPDSSLCTENYPFATPCWREGSAAQARRFMHELGHMIGFGHGGRVGSDALEEVGDYFYYQGNWDDLGGRQGTNRKPNYISLMNYTYNGALLCVMPPLPGDTDPRFVSYLNYSEASLGDLDETRLDERPNSSFARSLRATACPGAAFGAKPAVIFTCRDPDESDRRYQVVSDGENTIARIPQGGRWSFTPPAHAAGIDWNCDGTISAEVRGNINGDGGDFELPGELCDGRDNNDNGTKDEGCRWNDSQELFGHGDWPNVPSPPECLVLYNDRSTCYPQIEQYRDAIAGPDCRSGGSRRLCNGVDVIFSGMVEPAYGDTPPNTELCDGVNNDGDDEIDEGCLDTDADGVSDSIDNCPGTANPLQEDRDDNLLGDSCQSPGPVANVVVTASQKALQLEWDELTDVRGYAIYRESEGKQALVYLDGGSGYPSSTDAGFDDVSAVGQPGDYVYHIRSVNLFGIEGPESTVAFTLKDDGNIDNIRVGPVQADIPPLLEDPVAPPPDENPVTPVPPENPITPDPQVSGSKSGSQCGGCSSSTAPRTWGILALVLFAFRVRRRRNMAP